MAFWVNEKCEGEKLDVECTAGIAGQGLRLCRMPAKEWRIWSINSLESMCLLLSRGTATAIDPKGLCVDARAGTSVMMIYSARRAFVVTAYSTDLWGKHTIIHPTTVATKPMVILGTFNKKNYSTLSY